MFVLRVVGRRLLLGAGTLIFVSLLVFAGTALMPD